MKKDVKLYNVLFPLWMLLMFPQMWLIVLPGNFIIDSVVLLISMRLFGICEKKQFYKSNILTIFSAGILSDVIGSLYMLLMVMTEHYDGIREWYTTIPGLIISAVMIFILNYYITFRKCEKKQRLWLSLIFAVVTAPYTFLVPSSWLYSY